MVAVGGVDTPSGGFSSSPDPERTAAATSGQGAAACCWGSLSVGRKIYLRSLFSVAHGMDHFNLYSLALQTVLCVESLSLKAS